MLRQFRTEVVSTAPSEKLLTMLYDRLVLDLERGAAALADGPNPQAAPFLTNAQDIVHELRCSLDVNAWDGGQSLMSVYDYVYTQLVRANISGDAEKVRECRDLLAPIRDAWHEAIAQVSAPAEPAVRSVTGELGVG